MNNKFKQRRKSPIWFIEKDILIKIVNQSQCFSEILAYFGLENKGGNYITLKKRLKEDNIDFTKISKNENFNKIRGIRNVPLTKEECLLYIFTESSTWSRNRVRSYLIKYELIPYKCECGLDGMWQGKKLSLQLHHKNGVGDDNKLENLSFLCPNCHSQTDTFAGRANKNIQKTELFNLCDCGKKKCKNSKQCRDCSFISRRGKERLANRKVLERPSKESLESDIKTMSILQISKKYGLLSDNSIRKWCKDYNINWKQLSPFSLLNRKAKFHQKKPRSFASQYKYVHFEKLRNKWCADVRNKDGNSILVKRFDTELEAAEAVKIFLNAPELILR